MRVYRNCSNSPALLHYFAASNKNSRKKRFPNIKQKLPLSFRASGERYRALVFSVFISILCFCYVFRLGHCSSFLASDCLIFDRAKEKKQMRTFKPSSTVQLWYSYEVVTKAIPYVWDVTLFYRCHL